jgi:hypothetical protein
MSHSIVYSTQTFVFRSLHAEHDKDALRRVRFELNVRFAVSVWPSELNAGAKERTLKGSDIAGRKMGRS